MSRLILALLAIGLFVMTSPASAYVWRCHTPNGDVWMGQPTSGGNCEEYDGTFNPNAASPSAPPVEYAPAPTPPVYAYPYPYPYPVPYPSYPPPPRYRYYGGPGFYLGLPPLVFDFRIGPSGHGGHFRGHRWH
jgi:hypothetical protein